MQVTDLQVHTVRYRVGLAEIQMFHGKQATGTPPGVYKLIDLTTNRPVNSVVFSCSVVSDSFNPVDCSTPGFPVLHHLLKLAQTHVH